MIENAVRDRAAKKQDVSQAAPCEIKISPHNVAKLEAGVVHLNHICNTRWDAAQNLRLREFHSAQIEPTVFLANRQFIERFAAKKSSPNFVSKLILHCW